RVGIGYLHFDAVLLPVYALLFIINAFLQALKRPIYVLWISIYRQGFGVAFFVWLYLTLFGWDIWHVWYGIGTSVVSGLLLSVLIAHNVAGREIGGLWRAPSLA
ncbi:MAG: MATE family efflux transporter, partial [Paracoccaceae bacterium]|nr:MATE family efflux transporter [Paracoccaceae bacterium]